MNRDKKRSKRDTDETWTCCCGFDYDGIMQPAFGQMTAEDWYDKGVNLSNQSNYNEALIAFDKAIELNPQYAEAWAGKGFHSTAKENMVML